MKQFITTIAFAILLLVARPETALANDWPQLHDVTDVASDDVLNVRAAPTGSADIVGSLAYNATNIEVLQQQGNWGLVNTGEQSGWASMRFLQPVLDGVLPEHPVFTCFGTEPFWNLSITQGQTALLSSPNGPAVTFGVGMLRAASGRFSPFAMSGAAGDVGLTVVTSPRSCNDGMTDREYALEGTIVITGSEPLILSGCCTLSR